MIKSILDKLQKEASKQGYKLVEAKCNEFPWIKADSCFYLEGYKPNYDIRDDYGNKYPHDQYKIVSDICTNVFGRPFEIHTPMMDKTRDPYWGTSYERWKCVDIVIVNYIYGHPKSGFFNTYLYIHNGKLDCNGN
jgi:hypothetical protein